MLRVMIYWSGLECRLPPQNVPQAVYETKARLCRSLERGCTTLERVRVCERERDQLGYGGEDAEPGTELLDGSSGFEPAVPLLLLCLEELITEVLPLLWGERAQDPVRGKKKGESEAKRGRNVSEHAGVHYHFVGEIITIKWLYFMHLFR